MGVFLNRGFSIVKSFNRWLLTLDALNASKFRKKNILQDLLLVSSLDHEEVEVDDVQSTSLVGGVYSYIQTTINSAHYCGQVSTLLIP